MISATKKHFQFLIRSEATSARATRPRWVRAISVLLTRARYAHLARDTCALLAAIFVLGAGGCASIRVTDPARTATEQYLMSQAVEKAVAQVSAAALLDRQVYIDSTYLTGSAQTSAEIVFLLGELRARLLLAGVRIAEARDKSDVILEVRTEGIGIDRIEFLLGIPAIYLPSLGSSTGGVPVATPELAIIKRTTQKGFGSITYIAYWRTTGEVVSSSGPFVGRTSREDYWFFGIGPRTIGDIVPTEQGK